MHSSHSRTRLLTLWVLLCSQRPAHCKGTKFKPATMPANAQLCPCTDNRVCFRCVYIPSRGQSIRYCVQEVSGAPMRTHLLLPLVATRGTDFRASSVLADLQLRAQLAKHSNPRTRTRSRASFVLLFNPLTTVLATHLTHRTRSLPTSVRRSSVQTRCPLTRHTLLFSRLSSLSPLRSVRQL